MACIIALFSFCKSAERKEVEFLSNPQQQNLLFNQLLNITNNEISEYAQNDSLSFLILPVHASCPYCRRKIINDIADKHKNLDAKHFIIISAGAGRKTINSYFRNENKELPLIPGKIYLDTTNMSLRYGLYTDKPVFYYTNQKKVYLKISSIPYTVKSDLKTFFK